MARNQKAGGCVWACYSLPWYPGTVFKGKWETPAARLSTYLNDNNTVWMSIRPQTCIQQFVQYGNSWLTFSTNKMGLRHTMWKTVSKIMDMIEIWRLISITKYLIFIYKEYHNVCPLVGIGNFGTLPPPLSPASMPLPPEPKGGGGHSPAGEGLGKSQFRRLEKSLALCLLCDLNTDLTIMYD